MKKLIKKHIEKESDIFEIPVGIPNFKIKKRIIILICLGLFLILTLLSILKSKNISTLITNLFFSFLVSTIPYLLYLSYYDRYLGKLEEKYLSFISDLYESLTSGLDFIKSLDILSKKNYGELTPYIKKLNVWISWNIPFPTAFKKFSDLLKDSKFILKANTILLEGYNIGGDLKNILKCLVDELYTIKRLEKEKKSALLGQAFTMFFIFLILVVVILVLKGVLIPILSQMNLSKASGSIKVAYFKTLFGSLLLTQAVIIGLIVGVILDGKLKSGLKYSSILFGIGLFVYLFIIKPTSININVLVYINKVNPGDPFSLSCTVSIDGRPYEGPFYIILEDKKGNIIKKEKKVMSGGSWEGSIKTPFSYSYDIMYVYAQIDYLGNYYKSNKQTIFVYQ